VRGQCVGSGLQCAVQGICGKNVRILWERGCGCGYELEKRWVGDVWCNIRFLVCIVSGEEEFKRDRVDERDSDRWERGALPRGRQLWC